MESDKELTPALEAAKRRRVTLHDALVHLEEATSSAAAGRVAEWTEQVLKETIGMRDAFDQHVVVAEKPGGLYEEIMERAPRLAGKVQRLHADHPVIREAIVELATKLEAGGIDDTWPLDEARDDLQRVLGRVVRHRQHGADLVWEAYNVDIGGPE
jgi:hypothetical protein